MVTALQALQTLFRAARDVQRQSTGRLTPAEYDIVRQAYQAARPALDEDWQGVLDLFFKRPISADFAKFRGHGLLISAVDHIKAAIRREMRLNMQGE